MRNAKNLSRVSYVTYERDAAASPSRMSRASTIIPPPSDFPVPMPDVVADSHEPPASDSWRLLVELTKETVRPPSRELPVASESDALDEL